MSTINDKCPGLVNLCNVLNSETNYHFTPWDIIYFIRHVSIAVGCKNACTHCFSNAPKVVSQTSLLGFQKIINEIGYILEQNDKSLSFFHLGASNDPASIKEYYKYIELWRNSMPNNQTIKVFTHGWLLFDGFQLEEFERFLNVIKKYSNIKVVISFDEFSLLARDNWSLYLYNIVENLRKIVSVIGKSRIRVETFYTPHRKICKPQATLEYWRKQVQLDKTISFEKMIRCCDRYNEHKTCSKVTSGILKVFADAHLLPSDLIDMSRDCNSIFPGGRGKRYFKDFPEEFMQMGLDIQEQKVLYSLKDYIYKYNGLIINPDGTANLVDYHGFIVGKCINGGEKVIPYMSTINP